MSIPIDYEKCAGLCQNGGSCVIDSLARSPKCDCPGEWQGEYCERPPDCQDDKCGYCDPYSNINECRCNDGKDVPCRDGDTANALNDKEETASLVLTVIIWIIVVLLCGISTLATLIIYLRRRRQPFHHARLGENVEITNPMYTGDADDGPIFVSDHDKVHFANPVYESMYKGGSGPGLNSSGGDREMDTFERGAGSSSLTELENLKGSGSPKATASEEKKGLLEHNQD